MHLDPYRATASEIARIADLLRGLSLEVVIETGARYLLDPRAKHEPTLMTREAGGRERRIAFYRRAAEIGRDLGARVLSFWSGIDRSPGPDSPMLLEDGIRRVADVVRDLGLLASVEPEPGMALETTADFLAIEKRVPGLGLTLDVGHLLARWEGEPADVVARARPYLAQVHLEDMRRGVHEHLPPGDGEIDFSRVLGPLFASDYPGPICYELSRSSHAGAVFVKTCAEHFRRLRSSLAG
ncbi:MAG: sugar phosphate isomerase/epimerase [Planctomycetota bacterium]